MKTATLLSLAAMAFVTVSATPREAKVRAAEPEPATWTSTDENNDDGSNSPPEAGLMCGYGGVPRVPGPSLTEAQSATGFVGLINAKKGTITAPTGHDACTQVSCVNGVAASFCGDVS